MNPTRILITGAAGRIGRTLSRALAPDYRLRLFDKQPIEHGNEVESSVGDLADETALQRDMQGIDLLIHLAAIPDEAPFETLLEPNILGTYRAFEAARKAGVKRILYASSVQAVGFHRMEHGVGQDSRIRPSGYYGVTKAFGEALASLYADKFGLSVACLRIASFEPQPKDPRHLRTWFSPEDCVRLFRACIEAPPFSFVTVYGVSANTCTVVRDAVPAPIDYRPLDNAEPLRAALEQVLSPPATTLFAGGEFCGRDFVGEFERVR